MAVQPVDRRRRWVLSEMDLRCLISVFCESRERKVGMEEMNAFGFGLTGARLYTLSLWHAKTYVKGRVPLLWVVKRCPESRFRTFEAGHVLGAEHLGFWERVLES